MSYAYGQVADLALLAMEEHGPMTRADLQELVGCCKGTISRCVARMMAPRADGTPRKLYILKWEMAQDGQRKYPRPVYALTVTGREKDARKPKADPLANKRAYWQRKRTRLMNSSPFRMGGNLSALMRGGS